MEKENDYGSRGNVRFRRQRSGAWVMAKVKSLCIQLLHCGWRCRQEVNLRNVGATDKHLQDAE